MYISDCSSCQLYVSGYIVQVPFLLNYEFEWYDTPLFPLQPTQYKVYVL